MSDPAIYVIPTEYYGGAIPKAAHKAPALQGAPLTAAKPIRKLSAFKIVIIVVVVLFLAVIGGATWYFTRGLRAPVLPPPTVEVQPSEPAAVAEPVAPPPAPVVVPEPEPTPPPTHPLSLSDDPDHDSLTEAEEVLYGTNSSMPDTDSDGYLDGHEVINLYNPAGTAPEKLEPAGFAVQFRFAGFPFGLLYPRSWQVNQESGGRVIVFQGTDGEAVRLTIVENLEKQPFAEWLTTHETQTSVSPFTSNKQSRAGFISTDGSVIYIDGGDQVAVLRYTTPQDGIPRYQATLKMMANSFSIRE